MKSLLILAALFSTSAAMAVDIPAGLSDQQTVDFLVPVYNAKTGRSLGARVSIWDGRSNLGTRLTAIRETYESQGAFAITIPAIIDIDGKWQVDESTPNNMSTCFIAFLSNGDRLTGRERQSVLAHELYHCYQFQTLGTEGKRNAPDWLLEGGANYVGESVVGGSASMGSWWEMYLTQRTPFVGRTYDGFGLFFHLEARAIDPWMLMENILKFNGTSEERMVRLINYVGLDAVATWAMSLARHPDWGSEWQAQGKDIPPHSTYPAEVFSLGDETIFRDVEFSKINHYSVNLRTSRPVRVDTSKLHGQIRIVDDSGRVLHEGRLEEASRLEFCTEEYCGCPGGDEAINFINVQGASRIIVAAVGVDKDNTGTLMLSEAVPQCCVGSRSLDPRLVGTWSVETQPLVENFIKLQYPGQTRVISGSQTVTIGRNGTIYKSNSIHLYSHIPKSPGILESFYTFNISGGFQGCLETKPYPSYPGRFSFTISNVSNSSRTTWYSKYGASGSKAGEDVLVGWGIHPPDEPEADQSAYGEFISDDMIGIRGTTVRRYRKIRP